MLHRTAFEYSMPVEVGLVIQVQTVGDAHEQQGIGSQKAAGHTRSMHYAAVPLPACHLQWSNEDAWLSLGFVSRLCHTGCLIHGCRMCTARWESS
jgi:hypothetical protein